MIAKNISLPFLLLVLTLIIHALIIHANIESHLKCCYWKGLKNPIKPNDI